MTLLEKYQAMHGENSLSSWLRIDGKNKEETIRGVGKETEEETGKKRLREEEREENETVLVKRRCLLSVSTEAFEFFRHGEMSESGGISSGDLWDDPCGEGLTAFLGLGRVGLWVLVVTDVPVSPSSVVTEVCDGFSLGSDGELLEQYSFSFSKRRAHPLDSCAGRDEV